MDKCENISNSFEEGWPLLEKAVDSLINQIEGAANFRFTIQDYMSCYTTVYNMCTDHQLGDQNCKLLYGRYKDVFETYINSTVLPSLHGKKDGVLLIELLSKWSNYKLMTKCLSSSFCYLNRYFIPNRNLTSTEETSFLMFYDLLHKKINVQVADAVTAMIDQGRAGEQIDRTLVNNTFAMYSEIGVILRINNAKDLLESLIREHGIGHLPHNLRKEEKFPGIPTPSSKKIRLVSSDGDVFEVDYGVGVGLMSKTIEDAIKTNPSGGTESILVYPVSSKILTKVIEYCKKYTEASDPNYKEGMSGVDTKDWHAEFIDVDNNTLLHLHLCAKFLNIKSLLHLTLIAIVDKIAQKAPVVIRQMFNIMDN